MIRLDGMQHDEFEYAGAEDGLKRLHMPPEGREKWLTIMGRLEDAYADLWDMQGLYWYCTREPYGDNEYKWRAYTSINLTEVTLEWPRS